MTSHADSSPENLLREPIAVTTLICMPKSEQVRVPLDVAKDGRIVAAELGQSWPEYAARVLREAIARDLPKVVQALGKRMVQNDDKPHGRRKNGGE